MGERLDELAGERKGRGEEASIAEAIATLAGRAMDAPWSAGQIREALASPRASLMCQEDEDGAMVGFVLGRRVDQVPVDPDRRRRGIGCALLEELIAAEGEGGVTTFRLELAARNAAAAALYAAVGFVVVGRRARYYPDGDDALLLTWTAEDAAAETGRDGRRGE